MKFTSAGHPICSPTDHLVLQRLSAWKELPDSIFFRDSAIPQIPSAQIFVLLFYNPGSYGSYIHALTEMMKISNRSSDYYHSRDLISLSGKVRRIEAPAPMLMGIQRWILKNILNHIPLSDAACAYRKGCSLAHNAAPHIGKKCLVKLDISHFFESISYGRVYGIFRDIGYSKAVSTLLGKLCTLRGHLPQGAPTSPALANIVLSSFDETVLSYCTERGIGYTRYSDDLTFSADKLDPKALIRFVRDALFAEGFLLNKEKIRVLGSGAQHRVCGLVVNNKLSVPKSYRHQIRQEMHYLTSYPLQDHVRRLNDPRFISHNGEIRSEYYIRNLLGRVQFVNQIRPSAEFRAYATALSKMLFALEEYPEHPSRCGYLLEGRDSLREEILAIAANASQNREDVIRLLIPHAGDAIKDLLEVGVLTRDEETNDLKPSNIQDLLRLCVPEMQMFSYEKALLLLTSSSQKENRAHSDLLCKYLFDMAKKQVFPYQRFSALNEVLAPWIRRTCRSLWKESILADTVPMDDRAYTEEETAILCTLSFLPEGISERFAKVLFSNVHDALAPLVAENRICWVRQDRHNSLLLRPEAFLSFYGNMNFPWSWKHMEPILRSLTEANPADFQPAPLAQRQVLRLLHLTPLAAGTPQYILPAIHHLASFLRLVLFHSEERGDS